MAEPNQMRIIIQASIPIESASEGEAIYAALKTFILNYSVNSTMNGQIVKMLEPCCKEKKT